MYHICCIIKNEHPYLNEWISHHLTIGFNEITIVEDIESKSHKLITNKYSADKVHLIPINTYLNENVPELGWHRQMKVYNKFIFDHLNTNDWVLFIDVDEYLMLDSGESLKSITDYLDSKSIENCAVFWKCFNANGHMTRPKNGLVKSYTKPLTEDIIESDYSKFKYGVNFLTLFKTFMKLSPTNHVGFDVNVHDVEGLVDIDGNDVWMNNRKSPRKHDLNYKKFHLNHYFTKSWEDWCRRINRGNMHDGIRMYEEFFDLNPELKEYKEQCIQKIYDKTPIKACVFTVIKNERLYIEEWVEHYIKMGFGKIFICEDYGSESHRDLLEKYGKSVQLITQDEIDSKSIEDGGYTCIQDRCFEWFIDKEYCKGNWDWCFFPDSDEFLEFKNPHETLQSFLINYANVPAVGVYWKCYGANQHYKREPGTVEQLYKVDSNILDINPIRYYSKVFVNLNYSKKRNHFNGVHIFGGIVDTDSDPINFNLHFNENKNYNKCWLNHYVTKSFEDWLIKLKRGYAIDESRHSKSKIIGFFEKNADMSQSGSEYEELISKNL